MTYYRLLWLVLLAACAAALLSGRSIFWAVAGALLALSLAAPAWAWLSTNWLRFSRRAASSQVQVGGWFEESLRLTNLSLLPRLWIEVVDHSTLPGHNASRWITLLAGRQWRGWRVSTLCTQRGAFTLGPVEVCASDPLGLFEVRRRLHQTRRVLVLPYTCPLSMVLPTAEIGFEETARLRQTLSTSANVSGVREYAAGDSLNRIHWPSTARRQKLIAKAFEQDPVGAIWLVLDLERAVHFTSSTAKPVGNFTLLPPSTEEYTISLAASLAQHFLEHHRAVGLIAWSQHRLYIPAEPGTRQLKHILEQLAVVRAEGELPFAHVIAEALTGLPRSAFVIAISPSPDPAWGNALQQVVHTGRAALAVVFDRASFGEAQLAAPPLAALTHPKLAVRVVRYGQPFAETFQVPAR